MIPISWISPPQRFAKRRDARVQTMNQLATLMRFYRAGDVVTVTVVRDGEQVDLEVELASRPEGT